VTNLRRISLVEINSNEKLGGTQCCSPC